MRLRLRLRLRFGLKDVNVEVSEVANAGVFVDVFVYVRMHVFVFVLYDWGRSRSRCCSGFTTGFAITDKVWIWFNALLSTGRGRGENKAAVLRPPTDSAGAAAVRGRYSRTPATHWSR